MSLTIEQLQAIMPHAGSRAFLFYQYLSDAIDTWGIKNVPAFLATICVESGSLLYTSEIASGMDYNDREDLGNTSTAAIEAAARGGKAPGAFYKGHGLIQITGYYNHKACGDGIGVDAVNNPTMLTQPEHACTSAAWFWTKNRIDDVVEPEAIRRKVNGGLNGYKDFLDCLARATVILG